MWKEIVPYLNNLLEEEPFDLYITTTLANEKLFYEIENIFKEKINLSIEVIPNTQGADIYPFLHVLNKINLDDYQIVYKLHTKQNIKNKFAHLGSKMKCKFYIHFNLWRDFLINEILGIKSVKKCLEIFEKQKQVGAIGFMPLLMHITEVDNKLSLKPSEMYDKSNKIFEVRQINSFKFFGGTIFAIRAKLLKICQNKFNINDFIDSPEIRFVSKAFFMEAFFGYLVEAQGYKFSGTNIFSNKTVLQLLSKKILYPLYKLYVNIFIFKKNII